MTEHLGLLLLLRRLCGTIGRCIVNLLDQLHSTDRAGTRFVLDDEGMHGAGVKLFALGCLALGGMIMTFVLPGIPTSTRCRSENDYHQGDCDFLVQGHDNKPRKIFNGLLPLMFSQLS